MNRTILFSPVGGTDPISLSNCRDGSMLHICRVYQPDQIYLYLSCEMLEYQRADDRYRYCLKRLYERLGRELEIELIERPELKDVQEFDYFYEDFRAVIRDIIGAMDATDQLLLNISSGTPAMKSGLLVLTTLGEFPCRPIQVVTPEKGINEHIHKDYDVETLWELDEDNGDAFENRCREVCCPTLSALKKEEIIKKHLAAYDYAAALEVVKTMPADQTKRYSRLLEMGYERMLLNFNRAKQIAEREISDSQVRKSAFPVEASNEWKYFEYALNLDLKLRRREYADFIRAITPLIVDLFELILKKQANLVVDRYCREITKEIKIWNRRKQEEEKRYIPVRLWDEKKLSGTEVQRCLLEKHKQFQYGTISSDHLSYLICSFVTDEHIQTLAKDLRGIEEAVRNQAAHEIVSVTDESIKKKTGFLSGEIMDKLKEAFVYSGIHVSGDFWGAYDAMNQYIIEQI